MQAMNDVTKLYLISGVVENMTHSSWSNYMNYTGILTSIAKLSLG